ncbi:hypothetical protein RHSIM_Rhsim02G0025400 [Rhododendron simsii]|uniref:Uncharacterized protein n=1 Tax=Rhododendron simsii TaxID=118357 RepID=A0A834HAG1_RHOSS|nr:hypothetical protein RHSIM_Rhsim02G0025400 [Rhododendron simsii]
MTLVFSRKCTTFPPVVNSCSLSRILCFSSTTSTFLDNEKNEATQLSSGKEKGVASGKDRNGVNLSSFFSHGRAHLEACRIELVDDDSWRVSSGLAEAWRGTNVALERKGLVKEAVDEVVKYDLDFDDVEDMRIRGNLFYKIDRDSKEFEEYSFDFHRRKSSKNKNERKESEKKKGSHKERNEFKKRENPSSNLASGSGGLSQLVTNEAFNSTIQEMENVCVGKKVRTLTFNQITAPYHEPFCLDIYVSKGSVRACIIHRGTSKVVAVAHSISKDMKFDLASKKDATTCAAVGEVLAQRALADDIHNAVYTPRKGEKLEGKIQIVLQSIIDNGVSVKVKIKQRKLRKTGHLPNS